MAFLVILRRTLIDLTGPLGNLVILLIGVGISVLICITMVEDDTGYMSAEMLELELIGKFLFMAFIWGAGFFLAITVSVKGAGLIARESSEGTLTLLVSRPVSRWQILAGKLVALVIYGILLDLLILLLSAMIISIIKPVTEDTLGLLLSAILHLLPYILLVTMVFASISVTLSTITTRRIGITAVMCIVVAAIFLFGPIITNIITHGDYDEDNNNEYLEYFDLSRHFGDIYITVIQSVDEGHVVPFTYDGLLSDYLIEDESTSRLVPVTRYSDMPVNKVFYPFEYSLRLSPGISLAMWLSVIILCLAVAFRTMERKQVT